MTEPRHAMPHHSEGRDAARAVRQDTISINLVRRLAAMLDLDPGAYADGIPLPRGWHPIFFSSDTRQSELKPDGMMSLGIDLPPIELPNVVMGGRRTRYLADIPIGSVVTRTSEIEPVARKAGRSGALAIVTVVHRFERADTGDAVLLEEQDYIYRDAATRAPAPADAPPLPAADFTGRFEPDETLVFRYSAVTYNTHRIHFDYPYTRDVEGYPAIIVNGGLTTLMLVEEFKRSTGLLPVRVASRNRDIVPLGRPVLLKGRRNGESWSCWAEIDGRPVLEAEIA